MKDIPNQNETLGLTTAAGVADLVPADVFSELALEAVYAERQLAGVISATAEDLTAEAGSTVQVPYISRRTLPSSVAAGATVTAANTSVGTYSISLTKYGDRDTVQREVWEDQKIFDREDFVLNIARAFAEKVDDLCFDELETAAAGSSKTLAVAGTLTDVYDKIVECKAAMKKLKYKPGDVIFGPDVEAQLLKDTSEGIKEQNIAVSDGMVLKVAGLSAIVTPLANANAATAGMVQAIIIDRRRALGEAWGRRPDFSADYINTSDVFELVGYIRYGAAELDVNAIGHVKNP